MSRYLGALRGGFVHDDCESRIRRLENDLDLARMNIIYLMPEPVQQLLRDYYRCESREATYQWEREVTDTILAMAEPLPQPAGWYGSERAYCPLCKGGVESFYGEKGYALPIGLERHLTGWGRNQQCPVTDAAFALARDAWHDTFMPREREESAEKERQTAERRRSETLYRIRADGEPQLFDEGFSLSWRPPRDADGLAWAERRLQDLGFRVAVDGRVKAYVDMRPDALVYADPRANGEIACTVYAPESPGEAGRKSRRKPKHLGSFAISDRWKHDLPAKYRKRLEEAAGRGRT